MTELTISDDLAERIEERVRNTEYESIDEYAEFALNQIVTRVERESVEERESAATDEEIQSRLQSLGYLQE